MRNNMLVDDDVNDDKYRSLIPKYETTLIVLVI